MDLDSHLSLPWAVAACYWDSDKVKSDRGSAIPVEYVDLCIKSHEKIKKIKKSSLGLGGWGR